MSDSAASEPSSARWRLDAQAEGASSRRRPGDRPAAQPSARQLPRITILLLIAITAPRAGRPVASRAAAGRSCPSFEVGPRCRASSISEAIPARLPGPPPWAGRRGACADRRRATFVSTRRNVARRAHGGTGGSRRRLPVSRRERTRELGVARGPLAGQGFRGRLPQRRCRAAAARSPGQAGQDRPRFDFTARMAMIVVCANLAASPPTGARSASSQAPDPGASGDVRALTRGPPSRRRARIASFPPDPIRHPPRPVVTACPCAPDGDRLRRPQEAEPWPRRPATGTENPASQNAQSWPPRRRRRSLT